ncbi:FAD synthetase family protein [Bacillus shivajii]|uniref:FAD synthetase family protein n=1 Tax=Bacillus shivajii TaxID=1983719 RepID=UPI001CFA2367|nr:FAD synthetase family protein [Bacillus shivajii]UCZ52745.1 FAD synthetase family protein [Bacillus shivajii]
MNVYKNDQLELNQSIVTVGAFDGIHRGHRALIHKAKAQADKYSVPLVVYTFDRPPRVYFQNQMMLMTQEEKMTHFQQLGVTHVIFASFTRDYASRSVDDFIKELNRLTPLEIWVGPDFQFGKGKSGTLEDLKQHFNAYKFPAVKCAEGEVISSTRIRKLIFDEDYEKAALLLGKS